MMRRRTFIASTVSVLAAPLAAEVQPSRNGERPARGRWPHMTLAGPIAELGGAPVEARQR